MKWGLGNSHTPELLFTPWHTILYFLIFVCPFYFLLWEGGECISHIFYYTSWVGQTVMVLNYLWYLSSFPTLSYIGMIISSWPVSREDQVLVCTRPAPVLLPSSSLKICLWDSGQLWARGKLCNLLGCLLEVISWGHCPHTSFVSSADSCFSDKS